MEAVHEAAVTCLIDLSAAVDGVGESGAFRSGLRAPLRVSVNFNMEITAR